jgi:5,10-methylenetetrahydromethanopterin reductase
MALTLGFAYVPTLPPERLRSLAEVVEDSGLDELWVWEDCFKESAIASATAALAWTSRITVGIGIMPAPLRNVAVCAMEVAMLERMFPGRLIAGVGHGVQMWMEQVGAKVASPLTLLAEYTDALRLLLAGERVTVAGRYVQLDGVALDWPPQTPPPLMLGGAGPKSLALAARLGDGNLLGNVLSPDDLRGVTELVASERRSDDHAIVATLIAATGPGAAERLAEEIPKWGRPAAPGVGVAGDAGTVAAAIREMGDLGVTTVIIQPTEDEPDLDGFIRFLGAEVKPLLV